MYEGYVVKAGEVCKDERVAKAIKNFQYGDKDVICVGTFGEINEVNTFVSIQRTLGQKFDTPEEALEAYLETLNAKDKVSE